MARCARWLKQRDRSNFQVRSRKSPQTVAGNTQQGKSREECTCEGGAAWLRAELQAKNRGALQKLCAQLGLPQKHDGATLRKDQLLESIVDSFSSQEGWSLVQL